MLGPDIIKTPCNWKGHHHLSNYLHIGLHRENKVVVFLKNLHGFQPNLAVRCLPVSNLVQGLSIPLVVWLLSPKKYQVLEVIDPYVHM